MDIVLPDYRNGSQWRSHASSATSPPAAAPCGRILLIGQGLNRDSLILDDRFEDM